MQITKTINWEMWHRIRWHQWVCNNLHWHSYIAEFTLEWGKDKMWMVLDFYHFKEVRDWIMDNWDHAMLIDREDEKVELFLCDMEFKYYRLPYNVCSCENIAEYLYKKFDLHFQWKLHSVTVHETTTWKATYQPNYK